jgi:hypothetical protein
MKQISTGLCIVLLMLFNKNSIAQKTPTNKPSLFTDYPAVIVCTEAQLNSLFTAGNEMNVSLSLPGNLMLQGEVTNRATKYNNLQTVSVKLPAFRNILFSVTKRNVDSKKPVYTAYLLSADYADGYQLKRSADNTYQFVKIETAKLLPACNQ